MPFTVKKPTPIRTDSLQSLGDSVVDLAQYMEDEFGFVASALQGTEPDTVWNTVPPRPRRGTYAYADGTHWNPGQGEGPYYYTGTAWVPLFQYSFPTAPPIEVPAGSVMIFWQTAAPTGWTKLITQNDKALRVVSGSGGVAGGTNPFSTVMAQTVVGNHTLTILEIPDHTHPAYPVGDGTGGSGAPTTGGPYLLQGATGHTGGGGAHNHTIAMSMQYVDVILASKN